LRRLAETDRSLARQVRELLLLVREYGPEAVAVALEKAHAARAFGADLHRKHPVPATILNQLATDPLSLAEYDAFILRSRKDSNDATSHETEPTHPDEAHRVGGTYPLQKVAPTHIRPNRSYIPLTHTYHIAIV
jgi:hypothetical protein